MEDDNERPKSPFNENASGIQNIRDQDHAGYEFDPPNHESRPRPNLAPRGMSGIKTKEQQHQLHDIELDFDPLIEKSEMAWHEVIDGNFNSSEHLKGYSFELTLDEDGNQQTIDGSAIKQFDLKKDGLIIARFDNGWQHKSHLPEAQEVINKLKKQFPEQTKEFKSFADINPEDNNDIDL